MNHLRFMMIFTVLFLVLPQIAAWVVVLKVT